MGAGGSVSSVADNCADCAFKFGHFSKRNRRICLECQCLICVNCLGVHVSAAPSRPTTTRSPFSKARSIITGYCRNCCILISPDPTQQQLGQLKTKHLKAFLIRRQVPEVNRCVEKKDLVDLILANYGGRTHMANVEKELERHTELMSRQRVHPSGVSETHNSPVVDISSPSEHPVLTSGDNSSQASILSQTADTETKQGSDLLSKISLSEIESESELENLTVKQLKILLVRNLVDYKGCKEKHELIEKVKMLWQSRQANQRLYEQLFNPQGPTEGAPASHEEAELCKICMDSTIDCVLLNCGHMVTCTKCGKQMNECPICRQYVVKAVHIFRA